MTTSFLHRVLQAGASLLLAANLNAARAAEPVLAPLDPAVKVKVGSIQAFGDAPIFIALEHGYFKGLGLDVEVLPFANSSSIVAPLGAGQLDVGAGTGVAGLWNAEFRRIGIRAVADKSSISPGFSHLGLVVKADSPIAKCEDLKGKRVAVNSSASPALHSIDLWLHSCGLSLKDVDLRVLAYPDVATALANGAVDVAHLGEPLIAINVRKKLIRVLVREENLRPKGQYEQSGLLFFSPQFIARPEVANRFAVAYLRGVRDYLQAYAHGAPPAPWYVALMTEYAKIGDPGIFDTAVPAGMKHDARIDTVSSRSDYDWYKQNKFIVADEVKFDDVFDPRFIDFANRYLADHPPAANAR